MRQEYTNLKAFQDIYLEDSYVLDIVESNQTIEFSVEFVLTKKHPLYKSPEKGTQHCYHRGKIKFLNIRSYHWKDKQFKKFTDATGEIDYGNIDEFYKEDTAYSVSGDWGSIVIQSDEPELSLTLDPVLPKK